MTLRITLLVLVTGFFALIWTHDHPAPKPTPSQVSELAKTPNTSESEIVLSSERALEGSIEFRELMGCPVSQIQAAIPMPVIAMDEGWMFNDCQMPLPKGIVPGEYRAVSNTGMVREFTLTLEDLFTYRGRKTKFVTRDMYQSETEDLRWYFIRVQTEMGEVFPAIAERGGHTILPAVAEQSQNKCLQKQASRIIVNAGQTLATRLIRLVKDDGPSRISTETKARFRL
jgi:hypothetical protein